MSDKKYKNDYAISMEDFQDECRRQAVDLDEQFYAVQGKQYEAWLEEFLGEYEDLKKR